MERLDEEKVARKRGKMENFGLGILCGVVTVAEGKGETGIKRKAVG